MSKKMFTNLVHYVCVPIDGYSYPKS